MNVPAVIEKTNPFQSSNVFNVNELTEFTELNSVNKII